MGFTYQVDDELSLRLVEPQHAEELYAVTIGSREHIARWLPWLTPGYSVDGARAFCERSPRDFAGRKALAVSLIVDGKIVGGSGWTDWRQDSLFDGNLKLAHADIGYWIAESHQGKGLMTRAVRALTTLAFETYGIRRLTIRAEPGNEASWKVAERLGYRLEGTMRGVGVHAGRTYDHRLYAMLAEEWQG